MSLRNRWQSVCDLVCIVIGVSSAVAGETPAPIICAGGLPVLIRLLWQDRVPPTFLFCMLFQWLFISVNVFYAAWFGDFPGMPTGIPNLTETVAVAIGGLLCQAFGFALVFLAADWHSSRRTATNPSYNPLPLCVLCAVLSAGAALVNLPAHGSGLATIVSSVFGFRMVLLAILIYQSLSQSTTWASLARTFGTVAFCTVLSLGSRQSTFKEFVLQAWAAVFCAYEVRPRTGQQIQMNSRIAVGIPMAVAGLFVAGIVWESQIKPIWRTQALPENRIERIGAFFQLLTEKAPQTEVGSGTSALMKRMNNLWQLSIALQRVPRIVPHSDGALTLMAVEHVTMPRILFPHKKTLNFTNRLMAEKYLGIKVGVGASVGIGYLTEFYVDFGLAGALVAALLLGAILGVISWGLWQCAPSPSFAWALLLASLWGSFANYEANLAKALGAFISYGALYVVFAWIYHKLMSSNAPRLGVVPRLRRPRSTVSPITVPDQVPTT